MNRKRYRESEGKIKRESKRDKYYKRKWKINLQTFPKFWPKSNYVFSGYGFLQLLKKPCDSRFQRHITEFSVEIANSVEISKKADKERGKYHLKTSQPFFNYPLLIIQ